MTDLTLVIANKNYSSWSLRPWLAMKYFGLEFNEVRLAFGTPEFSSTIEKYSPARKVPVLLHGKRTIWDSLAICEYLAEEFSQMRWWPEDKDNRTIARCISAEMHSGFMKLRENMPMNCRASLPGKGMALGVRQDIDRITTIWRQSRQQFASFGEFLFGDFTIADAMYAPVVLRFMTYCVELDAVCRNYTDAILSLPAMKEWLTAAELEKEKVLGYEF